MILKKVASILATFFSITIKTIRINQIKTEEQQLRVLGYLLKAMKLKEMIKTRWSQLASFVIIRRNSTKSNVFPSKN